MNHERLNPTQARQQGALAEQNQLATPRGEKFLSLDCGGAPGQRILNQHLLADASADENEVPAVQPRDRGQGCGRQAIPIAADTPCSQPEMFRGAKHLIGPEQFRALQVQMAQLRRIGRNAVETQQQTKAISPESVGAALGRPASIEVTFCSMSIRP